MHTPLWDLFHFTFSKDGHLMNKVCILLTLLVFQACARGPIEQVHQKRYPVSFWKNFSKKNIGLSQLTADKQSLFWGSENGHVVRVSAKSMKKVWSKRFKESITTPVFIHEQKVFVGTQKGTLLALDYDTGKVLWENNYNTSIRGPMKGFGRTLFFVSMDGKLTAVDMGDGAVVMEQTFFVNDSFTLQYELLGAQDDQNMLLVLPNAEVLYINDSLDLVWSRNLQQASKTAFLSGFVDVQFLGNARFLLTPHHNDPLVVDVVSLNVQPILDIQVAAGPLVEEEFAFFVGQEKISKVDLQTLQVVETYPYQKSYPVGSVVKQQNTLFIAGTNGSLDVYDLNEQENLWTYETEAPLRGQLLDLEDQVWLLNQRSQLFAFQKPVN